MTQGARDEHVSNLRLDEWLSGELRPDESARVATHVQRCTACTLRREQRQRQAAEFLQVAPSFEAHARQFVRAPASALAPAPATRSLLGVVVVASPLLAAAALLVWLAMPVGPRAVSDGERLSSERSKGAPRVGFFVKRGAQVSRGRSGDLLHAGDLLRFTYSIDRPAYLALIDVDQRGARVYFPADAARAAAIAPGSDVALDFSVELDDTPGEERVYAVFCEKPDLVDPLRALLAGHARELPVQALPIAELLPGCELDALLLRKAAP